jgi:cysteine-rich repeat protein
MWSKRCSVGGLLVGLVASTVPVFAGGLSYVGFRGGGIERLFLKDATAAAVSPDGFYVYVAARTSDALTAWAYDPAAGLSGPVDVQVDGVNGVDGLRRVTSVAISADGAHVYAAGDGDNAVAVFHRDASTGRLDYVETQSDGVGGVSALGGPESVIVSPDGQNVYVGGKGSSSVVIFSRDATTGRLTFVGSQQNDVDGVQCLQAPRQVVLSPDGLFLYATALDGPQETGTIAVFARDTGSGRLTYIECIRNGDSGVTGLSYPGAVTISADGHHLYVASRGGDAVLTFSRDPARGMLTFTDIVHDGGIVDGVQTPAGIAIDPLGDYIYVAGHADAAVSVFRRNPATGVLGFLEVQRVDDAVYGDVLYSANGLAVSPDGARVYATAGSWHGGIATFSVDQCGSGHRGPDEECDDGNVQSGDGCSETCRLELCPRSPLVGCRQSAEPRQSSLLISNDPAKPADAGQLQWKLHGGAATALAEFGDPTATADYVLCVYDSSSDPQPLMSLAAPAGGLCGGKPCWRSSRSSFRYEDSLLTPDGLRKVRLGRGAADGATTIMASGRGSLLALHPLPLTPPVTVQLTNNQTGLCWQAVYDTFTRNDAQRYQAQSD